MKGLNPKKYLEDVEKFKKNNGNLINKLVKDLELTPSIRVIIMTGSPASGKTTLARQVVQKAVKNDFARNWTIYSLDIEGTKSKLKKKLIKSLRETDDGVIIDATNPTIASRAEWLRVINEVDPYIKSISIYINVPKELTIHLNHFRTVVKSIDRDHPSKGVPTVAINSYWKKYQPPTDEEDFEKIIEFDFDPIFKNSTEKKYFMMRF